MPCDPDLADTARFCEAYGVAPEDSANTILVVGKADPPATPRAWCWPPPASTSTRSCASASGVRKASFASAEETRALTGMLIGGVTAFGLPGEPADLGRRRGDGSPERGAGWGQPLLEGAGGAGRAAQAGQARGGGRPRLRGVDVRPGLESADRASVSAPTGSSPLRPRRGDGARPVRPPDAAVGQNLVGVLAQQRGTAFAIRPGVAASFTGRPVVRNVPTSGCSSSTRRSRANTWGSAKTSSRPSTGPAGTPASLIRSTQVDTAPWPGPASMAAVSASRFASRRAASAKRSSPVPLGVAEGVGQAGEHARAARRDVQVAVGGPEPPVGRGQRVMVTGGARGGRQWRSTCPPTTTAR